MELPMSSGQFQLSGLDVVDSMSAIHPSQLNIPTPSQINIHTASQLNIPTPSQLSPAMSSNISAISTSNMDMSGAINCYGGNGMSISSHISNLMSDPCIFTGVCYMVMAVKDVMQFIYSMV